MKSHRYVRILRPDIERVKHRRSRRRNRFTVDEDADPISDTAPPSPPPSAAGEPPMNTMQQFSMPIGAIAAPKRRMAPCRGGDTLAGIGASPPPPDSSNPPSDPGPPSPAPTSPGIPDTMALRNALVELLRDDFTGALNLIHSAALEADSRELAAGVDTILWARARGKAAR